MGFEPRATDQNSQALNHCALLPPETSGTSIWGLSSWAPYSAGLFSILAVPACAASLGELLAVHLSAEAPGLPWTSPGYLQLLPRQNQMAGPHFCYSRVSGIWILDPGVQALVLSQHCRVEPAQQFLGAHATLVAEDMASWQGDGQ